MDIYGLFCLAKYITTCIYWRYYRVKSDFLETLYTLCRSGTWGMPEDTGK